MSGKGKKQWLKHLAILALLGLSGSAAADGAHTAPIKTEKATLVSTLAPDQGFVDDPLAFDQPGSRLVYVNSDSGTSASAVVFDIAQRSELFRIDLKRFTLRPSNVEFANDGAHIVVWSDDTKTDKQRLAVLDQKGKVVRKFGPALDILRTNYEGHDAVVVHDVSSIKSRRGKRSEETPVVRHSVGVYSLATGRLLGKKTNLDLDATDKSAVLDFTLRYWASDFTFAVGIKGGEWDAKENQRSPDSEGWYLMPAQRFAKNLAITDVVAHREHMARMHTFSKRSRDVIMRKDATGIDFLDDGVFTPIKLAEPFHHYDRQSLVTQVTSGDSLFFTINIDPVHPDAAAARRAVTPWMDLYEYNPDTKKATRRARLVPPKGRKYSWRASKSEWAVMPEHIGFDRGGTELLLYKLD